MFKKKQFVDQLDLVSKTSTTRNTQKERKKTDELRAMTDFVA